VYRLSNLTTNPVRRPGAHESRSREYGLNQKLPRPMTVAIKISVLSNVRFTVLIRADPLESGYRIWSERYRFESCAPDDFGR
jgi:hypothetical protein